MLVAVSPAIIFLVLPYVLSDTADMGTTLDLNTSIDEFAKGVGPLPCELPVEDYATMSALEFTKKYKKRRQPVLLKNVPPLLKDAEAWSRSALLSRFGDVKFPPNGPLTERRDVLMSITNVSSERFFMHCREGIYGDFLRLLHSDLTGEPRNLYAKAGNSPVMSIGGRKSWNRIHVHGQAWQAQIYGLKLWWVGDSEGVYPEVLHQDEFKHWGGDMCDYVHSRPMQHMKYCLVPPGHAMYVPKGYYHGTCNLSPWTVSFGAQGEVAAQHFAMVFGDLEGFNEAVNMCKSESMLAGKGRFLDKEACQQGIVSEHGKALNTAAAHGHLRIIEHLVAHGANPGEVSGEDQMSPMHLAGQKGHLDVVKYLAGGAESLRAWNETLTEQLKDRCFPARVAEGGPAAVPVMKFLIGLRADVNQHCNGDSLMTSAVGGFDSGLAMVQLLVQSGAEVKHEHLLASANSDGDKLAITEYLVKALGGADIPDQLNQPLHAASMKGHLAIVELLLGNRAKVDAVDSGGMQAIHHVVETGLESLAKLLVDNGAGPHAQSNRGTPAEIAKELMKEYQEEGEVHSLALMKRMGKYLSKQGSMEL